MYLIGLCLSVNRISMPDRWSSSVVNFICDCYSLIYFKCGRDCEPHDLMNLLATFEFSIELEIVFELDLIAKELKSNKVA